VPHATIARYVKYIAKIYNALWDGQKEGLTPTAPAPAVQFPERGIRSSAAVMPPQYLALGKHFALHDRQLLVHALPRNRSRVICAVMSVVRFVGLDRKPTILVDRRRSAILTRYHFGVPRLQGFRAKPEPKFPLCTRLETHGLSRPDASMRSCGGSKIERQAGHAGFVSRGSSTMSELRFAPHITTHEVLESLGAWRNGLASEAYPRCK